MGVSNVPTPDCLQDLQVSKEGVTEGEAVKGVSSTVYYLRLNILWNSVK